MIDKSSIILQKCAKARFIEVCEMHYLENGVKKRWEVVKSSDSVSILINNLDSAKLIIVRQFRPAVFLRNNDGYMFELCAGLVDKKGKSLEQIAREEVFEECGYEAQNLVKIGEFYSSVGTSGSKQSVFYTEVRNVDKKTRGGGVDDEFIEIVEIPHDKVLDFLKTPNITPSLGFAFMWFLQNIESSTNSASCGDFLGSASARFVDEPSVLSSSLASHNPKNSSTILEFASCVENAESSDKIKSKKPLKSFCYFWLLPKVESPLTLNPNLPNSADSANQNNPSLRADSQNLRGNPQGFARAIARSNHPPYKFNNYRLPRSHSFARNDEILSDSAKIAESSAESNINL